MEYVAYSLLSIGERVSLLFSSSYASFASSFFDLLLVIDLAGMENLESIVVDIRLSPENSVL